MNKSEFFFHLLRAELLGERVKGFPVPTEVYHSLLTISDVETVMGMYCSALMNNDFKLGKYDAIEVYTILDDLAARNKHINDELKSLTLLLREHDIQFVVVKGQTLAALYPHPDVRMPGDIDFYCDAGNFEAAKKTLEEAWQVEMNEDEEGEQHLSFTHNEVHFEMHYRLMKFESSSNQKCFDRLLKELPLSSVEIDSVVIPVLEPTLNLLYTFLHLYHHFIELGVGLRQFCDVAILILQKKFNSEKLLVYLKKLGFTNAFKAIGVILVDRLGVPEEEFPFVLTEKDRKYEPAIAEIVMKRGNFGMYGRKNDVRSGIGYYWETIQIKFSHYFKFFMLSPKENTSRLLFSVPRKVWQAVRRR